MKKLFRFFSGAVWFDISALNEDEARQLARVAIPSLGEPDRIQEIVEVRGGAPVGRRTPEREPALQVGGRS